MEERMIEPDLKYCPRCNDEYRAEIEKCGVCGIELITGRRKIEMEEAQRKKLASRVSDISPDDDLVALRRGPLTEMRHLANLLAGEKIGSLLAGDEQSCGKGCCPTVYTLLVKREDGMDSLYIIEEEHRRTTGLEEFQHANADAIFNPAAGEACCPACGHSFPTTESACPDCGLSFG
jgi:hypothetical protein